jgi:hypothetical protein
VVVVEVVVVVVLEVVVVLLEVVVVVVVLLVVREVVVAVVVVVTPRVSIERVEQVPISPRGPKHALKTVTLKVISLGEYTPTKSP